MTVGCIGGENSSSKNPPQNFQESYLVGTWQANYGVNRLDTLIIRSNGSYQQIYHEPDGYTYESSWNDWYIEYKDNGKIYLHLKGMKYYPMGRELGESGGVYPLSYPSAGKVIHFYNRDEDSAVKMLDEVILRIHGVEGEWAPRNIILVHMVTDPDIGGDYFVLQK